MKTSIAPYVFMLIVSSRPDRHSLLTLLNPTPPTAVFRFIAISIVQKGRFFQKGGTSRICLFYLSFFLSVSLLMPSSRAASDWFSLACVST